MKKYELTDEKISYRGKQLYRIRALVSFGSARIGTIGGYVESEKNLSHEGGAWIGDNAIVCDDSLVSGNAWVGDNAQLLCRSQVYGKANVFHNAVLHYDAQVFDKTQVFGNAQIYNARVFGNAKVFGNAQISNEAQIFDDAKIYGDATVFDKAQAFNNAQIFGSAKVFDNSKVFGNSQVSGRARLHGNTQLSGDAWIHQDNHFIYLESPALQNNYITFFCNKAGDIHVVHGDFLSSIDEFELIVKTTNKEIKKRNIYLEAIKLAKTQFKNT